MNGQTRFGLVAACATALGAAAAADTITFEELGPQPCVFDQTQALTSEYSGMGVLFEGPQPGQGGAILDQCGSFGVNARSGVHFLAFNDVTYARTPETIRFTAGAGRVEIFASAGSRSGQVTMNAFDTGNNMVDSTTQNLVIGSYIGLEVNGNISYVVITKTSSALVLEDLTWDAGGRYSLSVLGQCPGQVTVRWSGATPNRQQGIVFASNQGNFVIPSGVCQGTRLGLGTQNLRLVNTIGTGSGSGSVNGLAGTAACGGFLQLVEAPSCNTSNVAQIP